MTKEELIEMLKKNHTHSFTTNIDIKTKLMKQTCQCGHVEEIAFDTIEIPQHKHEFKYTQLKTTFDDDEKIYNIKIAECKTCHEKRVYLNDKVEIEQDKLANFELSEKWIEKKEKTQIYYPKTTMSIVNFNGPIKYNDDVYFYIKSTDNKWYKTTHEISKYIIDHYAEWNEDTKILFKVDASKHIVQN